MYIVLLNFFMKLTESGKDDLRQVLAEKLELQRKLDMLMEKVRDLERENRELERFKESVPLKGARPISAIRDNAITVLEEENSELRRKISKLEAEMRDMERRHTKHVAEVSAQIKQVRKLHSVPIVPMMSLLKIIGYFTGARF